MRSLRRAQSRYGGANTGFIRSNRKTLAAHGPYDAIFCMAVLQRTPGVVESEGIADLGRIYPFWKFEKQVAELIALLKPGGLLAIEHAAYRIADTPFAGSLEPLASPHLGPSTRIFDREGLLLRGVARSAVIFRKRAGAAAFAGGSVPQT
jgi:hypothetical protein